jgi:ABC-2 type transport system ATP-binding protein
MIEVENLTKYYGRMAAIKDVNFRVESGEIVGFLGPNGAGKTTTMRILTCFSPASAGNVRILGMDVRTDAMKIRQKVGYLPEHVPLYDWMRVKGYLEFVARIKGIPGSQRRAEVDRVTQEVDLGSVTNKLIKWLSKGYRQRVGLAQALIGDPPILILDEPTIGLDPRQILEIRHLIKSFARNRTVILSSHILPEVSQVCDRVIIINKGSIIAEDSPANLAKSHRKSSRCLVVAKAPEKAFQDVVSKVSGVESVALSAPGLDGEVGLTVEVDQSAEVRPELARAVIEQGWDLLELRLLHVSLEEVFIDLVTEESEDVPTTEDTSLQEAAS